MSNMRTLGLVLLSLFAACSNGSRGDRQSPVEGIDFAVEINSVEWRSEHNSTFVFVDLRVGNQTESTVEIDISKIVAELDQSRSKYTYFDTLGSVEPRVEPVAVGGAKFALYFVFPSKIKSDQSSDLKIVEFGLVNH